MGPEHVPSCAFVCPRLGYRMAGCQSCTHVVYLSILCHGGLSILHTRALYPPPCMAGCRSCTHMCGASGWVSRQGVGADWVWCGVVWRGVACRDVGCH